jgi:hypothetical protein
MGVKVENKRLRLWWKRSDWGYGEKEVNGVMVENK